MPSRPPRLISPQDAGSGLAPVNPAQPLICVAACIVLVPFENTHPSTVPENVPDDDGASIVKVPSVAPTRMFPSNVMDVLGLIVASLPTIQKMLFAFAPFMRLKVMEPLMARFPGAWMMKIALALF